MPRRKSKRSLSKKVSKPVVEEQEDFRDYIDSTKVSVHLFCSICQEVFKHPVRAPCGHSYCKACILEWLKNSKTCPEDRKKLTQHDLHNDFILENIIGDQKVACPFRKYGCSVVCVLSTLPHHFKHCPLNTNNLPKFLKDSMDNYLSSQPTSLDQSALNSDVEDSSPAKYMPLKMRMYMQGGGARDGLITAFSNQLPDYEKLVSIVNDD